MLPLEAILDKLPSNHWTLPTKNRRLKVDQFCRFRSDYTCLETIPLYDAPPHPYLVRKLQKELRQETLCLIPEFNPLLTPSDEYPGNFDEQPLIDSFLNATSWITRTSREFHRIQTLLIHDHTSTITFPPASWSFFWTLPIALEARSLWFRLLYGKVYSRVLISSFDVSVSPFCQLCGLEREDNLHLFITCPFKLHVWEQAFMRLAPYTEFSVSHLQELVFDLQQFQLVDNEALFVLASKAIRSIWHFHWLSHFKGVPFQPE